MRKAKVYFKENFAGVLTEDDDGYSFLYDDRYTELENAEAVSLSLPVRKEVYHSIRLFPFFDGLIPEGWLLSIAEKNWKINPRDRMGLLLACCRDCIGAVSVRPADE